MTTLQHIAQQQPEMVLASFVEATNALLPQFLPDPVSGSRGQEPVNPRLVRHYTTQGWLDKPLKQGREARYTYRHLLQLLVLRRLLAEGYSTSSIGSLIGGQTSADLENILQGGVQLTVEVANPALTFLSQVREREALPQKRSKSGPIQTSPPASASIGATPLASSHWTRLAILDGLELHIRHDFVAPATAYERDRLAQLIVDHLANLRSSQELPP
ncbi:MAG: MerR family transcriptional regulator [Nodosilinea sp.]